MSPHRDPQLELFHRQYTQQFSALTYPPGSHLVHADVQQIFEAIFSDSPDLNIPPSYQARALDRIITLIEGAIRDPHEEGVIDELYQRRADLCLHGSTRAGVGLLSAAKSTLVYHAPTTLLEPATAIKIREAKNIIGAGADVGLRTWEASLRLVHYLSQHADIVKDATVLELGSGTGLLSIFCSAVLGAKRVIATDGLEKVVESMEENIGMNEKVLEGKGEVRVEKLAWEDEGDLQNALRQESEGAEGKRDGAQLMIPTVVLGADITYHPEALEPLVSLLVRILKVAEDASAPPPKVLISSTLRAQQTLDTFMALCTTHAINVKTIAFDVAMQEQKGLFHAVAMEIRIFEISKREVEGSIQGGGGAHINGQA